MGELDKFDKRLRNISLIIIFIAVLLLMFWMVSFLNSPEKTSPILMAIGVALLLGGILLVTRIQYVIWMKKRY
ncbi:MAG: hypothetical protein JSV23_07450 [Promethearchaeota archaeon]|nr:MAG: hypothetical protein JSV23_07450 [Candidatus Lokiarchaeota archaeon]